MLGASLSPNCAKISLIDGFIKGSFTPNTYNTFLILINNFKITKIKLC